VSICSINIDFAAKSPFFLQGTTVAFSKRINNSCGKFCFDFGRFGKWAKQEAG